MAYNEEEFLEEDEYGNESNSDDVSLDDNYDYDDEDYMSMDDLEEEDEDYYEMEDD